MSLKMSLQASQRSEFKSGPANRRWTSRLGDCNIWTSKKNWDGDLQSVEWRRLQEIGWSCLHIQRELRWTEGVRERDFVKLKRGWVKLPALPKKIEMSLQIGTNRTWGEENLEFFESQLFDSLVSAISDRMILELSGGELTKQSWDWNLRTSSTLYARSQCFVLALCLREDNELRSSPCFFENILEQRRVTSVNTDWLTTWTL